MIRQRPRTHRLSSAFLLMLAFAPACAPSEPQGLREEPVNSGLDTPANPHEGARTKIEMH